MSPVTSKIASLLAPEPVPTVNPDEYSITTSGRVNDIYNYNDPGGGILDIKFSYIYNI